MYSKLEELAQFFLIVLKITFIKIMCNFIIMNPVTKFKCDLKNNFKKNLVM